ncbi:MAG: hypothetical protein VKL39_16780 [Leptolyngbyaceae bacterium]|nr:hypothetical protein [Leptolyngbyaceae bacterium]
MSKENKIDQDPAIEDLCITVEEYLESMAAGIDILEIKRLEKRGISYELALDVIEITQNIIDGTASDEDVVRGLCILTPSLRHLLKQNND